MLALYCLVHTIHCLLRADYFPLSVMYTASYCLLRESLAQLGAHWNIHLAFAHALAHAESLCHRKRLQDNR